MALRGQNHRCCCRRHDAEVECLNSGAVKEGPGIVRIEPIRGPGICGADFATHLKKQSEEYGRIIREANIKAE